MVFIKGDLAVIVTCFAEKGWTGTLNPLDYSIWDILQNLSMKDRGYEPFANLNDLQNVIRDKWHDVDVTDQTMRNAILQWKKRLSPVAKQNGRPIQHIF